MTKRLPTITLALAAAAVVAPGAATERASAVRSLSQVESQASQARARESVLTGEVTRLSQRVRAVEARLAPVEARWRTLNNELTGLQTRRRQLTADLDRETARLTRLVEMLKVQRRALGARLSAAYRSGDPTMLQVLLQSRSISDAMSVRDDIQRITEMDRSLITETRRTANDSRATRERIRATRAEVWTTEKKVAKVEAEARVTFERVSSERNQLVSARAARSALLASVRVDRRELEAEARGLRARSARLASQIRAASSSASPAALPATAPAGGSGQLGWPVSGPITSPFGPRWGRMHEGIDISGSTGTPIAAAASGTVIVAGWSGGYGNLVVVSHGSIATAYAHMSQISVSIGQSVSRGTVVGGMGNTGHSFGTHLHFEVRVNGSPQNPINYL